MGLGEAQSRGHILLAMVFLALTIASAGLVDRVEVAGGDTELLCSFKGVDELYGMILAKFEVYGPEKPRVGDPVVVFFELIYVGDESPITLDRIYVSVQLPDGSVEEYEDKSFRGKTVNSGDTIKTHIEIDLTAKGEWSFWPSFEYHYDGKSVRSEETWDKCFIKVIEAEERTTPKPLPDLAFKPRYMSIGYTECQGFYARIKNIGQAPVPVTTYTMFRVTSLNTGTTWTFRVQTPSLDPGEEATVYSGMFIGVPEHEYRVSVILDYGDYVDEYSEYNNERRIEFTYTRAHLPGLNIMVGNLSYYNGLLYYHVRNSGCIDSPPITVHLDIVGVGEEVNDVAVQVLDSIEAGRGIVAPFSGVDELIRESGISTHVKLRVRVDPVQLDYNVDGLTVTIREDSERDNIAYIDVGGAPAILGPDEYFLPAGEDVYTIDDPLGIWPVVDLSLDEASRVTVSYRIEGCNARISYNRHNPTTLEIDPPSSGCPSNKMTLVITAESGGMESSRSIDVYFYELGAPEKGNYVFNPTCMRRSQLGATQPFLFTDTPIIIPYSPVNIIHSVNHRVLRDDSFIDVETRFPSITIRVSWPHPSGDVRTYEVPSNNIDLDYRTLGFPAISFMIPRHIVFGDIDSLAVGDVEIYVSMTLGSGQVIERIYTDIWLHNSYVIPSYWRSFSFENTGCPLITWDMWEEFWGADAVYNYIGDIRVDEDYVMEQLYDIFTEMCNYGRCSGFALSSQKFNQPYMVWVRDACSDSKPLPFTLPKTAIVFMNEMPSGSFESNTIDLDTYITYQYMWSLDERNILRGLSQVEKWFEGKDAIYDALSELWAWEQLPDGFDKWNNPYIMFMFSAENISNSHAVLVYRVERISDNHYRVWVVDSNRPFQPNNSTNQDNSHADFYCCDSQGRWYFVFNLDDSGSRVIDDFLFVTPTELFQGDSSAFTELDFLEAVTRYLDDFLEYMRTLGAASDDDSRDREEPAILLVTGDAGVELTGIKDLKDRSIIHLGNAMDVDMRSVSPLALQIPIPGPMTRPAYMFITATPVKMTLTSMDSGVVNAVMQGSSRALKLAYQADSGIPATFTIGKDYIAILKPNPGGIYTITSKIIGGGDIKEIIVTSNHTTEPIAIDFSTPGEVRITNKGNNMIALDVELKMYDKTGSHVKRFNRISIEPGDTATATPESWDNLEGSRLILAIDKGSDGSIDEEVVVDREATTAKQTETSSRLFNLPEELPVKPTTILLALTAIILLILLARRKSK
ncbi:MAG: hypothetical protein GSR85_01795 [Desulfurococcales archaeon]|nr:hypothetical protein [Desulfurococcales archaeon]